jgi:hypothetical protein
VRTAAYTSRACYRSSEGLLFQPDDVSFRLVLDLLALKPDVKGYTLVYHILYRALPIESKIDNVFVAYVVNLFSGKLDAIPDEETYTVLFHCIQMELHASALL